MRRSFYLPFLPIGFYRTVIFGIGLSLFSCSNAIDEIAEQGASISSSKSESIVPKQKKFGIPDPVPVVKVADIRNTIPLLNKITENWQTVIVGLPGSVAGEGTITIMHKEIQVQVTSTPQGSFMAKVEAKPREILSIQYEQSVPVRYRIASNDIYDVEYPPTPIDGIPPIVRIAPDKVRIRGAVWEFGSPEIIGINKQTGDIALATANDDLHFSFELNALPGDTILVYPDQQPLKDAWVLNAP